MAKATVTPDEAGAPPVEDFGAMLDESLKNTTGFERRVAGKACASVGWRGDDEQPETGLREATDNAVIQHGRAREYGHERQQHVPMWCASEPTEPHPDPHGNAHAERGWVHADPRKIGQGIRACVARYSAEQ